MSHELQMFALPGDTETPTTFPQIDFSNQITDFVQACADIEEKTDEKPWFLKSQGLYSSANDKSALIIKIGELSQQVKKVKTETDIAIEAAIKTLLEDIEKVLPVKPNQTPGTPLRTSKSDSSSSLASASSSTSALSVSSTTGDASPRTPAKAKRPAKQPDIYHQNQSTPPSAAKPKIVSEYDLAKELEELSKLYKTPTLPQQPKVSTETSLQPKNKRPISSVGTLSKITSKKQDAMPPTSTTVVTTTPTLKSSSTSFSSSWASLPFSASASSLPSHPQQTEEELKTELDQLAKEIEKNEPERTQKRQSFESKKATLIGDLDTIEGEYANKWKESQSKSALRWFEKYLSWLVPSFKKSRKEKETELERASDTHNGRLDSMKDIRELIDRSSKIEQIAPESNSHFQIERMALISKLSPQITDYNNAKEELDTCLNDLKILTKAKSRKENELTALRSQQPQKQEQESPDTSPRPF